MNVTLNANYGWAERDYELSAGVLDSDAYHVFQSGQCHSLALAIHDLTGWPVYGIRWDECAPGIPSHVCVGTPDGRYIDVAGEVSEDDAWDAAEVDPEWLREGVPNRVGDLEYRIPKPAKARHWVEPVLAQVGLTVPDRALAA